MLKKTVQQECENSRCVDLFTFWYMFMHIYTFVIYAFHLQVLFALVFHFLSTFVTFSTLFCIVHVFMSQLPVIHFKSAKIWCKKLEEFTHVLRHFACSLCVHFNLLFAFSHLLLQSCFTCFHLFCRLDVSTYPDTVINLPWYSHPFTKTDVKNDV